LSNNKLQELPNSIGDLNYLEELDLINNQIEVLPESMIHLTKLQYLEVDPNLENDPVVIEMGLYSAINTLVH
jgi:Leucine-rich repeat (LRR) protein